jgi:hypothetical protein
MLPQKFSAATTWIVFPPPEPADEAVEEVLPEEDEVEQAVAVIAVMAATPPRANRDDRRTAGRDGAALMKRDLLNQAGPRRRDTGTAGHLPR